jgi:multimeric flavodoxin WrbA
MMEDKVLGIVGSPRKGANTDAIVEQVLRGAREAGASTEKLLLAQMDIKPCNACDACQKTGTCVITDDFGLTLEKMKVSNVWVLGTPVYWWGPTAQMKAFIDRWYGVDRSVFRGKRIVLVVPSGGGSYYARQTVEMLESIIPYLGMRHVATIQTGTSGRESAKRDVSLMNKALKIGMEAVEK